MIFFEREKNHNRDSPFCVTLQDVVEYLWRVSLGYEVTLELRRTDVDAATEHVAEVAGKALLVGALRVLEIAHRTVVKKQREHGATTVQLDALAVNNLLKAGNKCYLLSETT